MPPCQSAGTRNDIDTLLAVLLPHWLGLPLLPLSSLDLSQKANKRFLSGSWQSFSVVILILSTYQHLFFLGGGRFSPKLRGELMGIITTLYEYRQKKLHTPPPGVHSDRY